MDGNGVRNPCPICGLEMTTFRDATDVSVIMEEGEECPTKHYIYHYITGGTEVYVGDQLWQWYYSDDPREIEYHKNEIDAAIKAAKERVA